ncbi:Interferon-induced very large GTPase 1 [Microtus ochrogaster]|uniref:Interferon-induced very large GTPase 1 n=1 Tax=Microtus ochrogaster TaxID=79684 RepID=A0A8J6G8K4_MICOH|nr:Interferon-induced very large GTPase 1 [Microtus ochrogaster]KAH0506344.1 Interferon-induced very large GTPase 1 [Microtus ochrogaster]
MKESRQQQAEQALQELRALQSEGKHREDEEVKKKEAELRQAMEIPEECWPRPEVPLKDVTEAMERHLNHMEQKLSYSENLPDRDLVKWASGGLALQGIYKTSKRKDQLAKREELLRVPKEFFLFAPEQGKMMDTKEFMSSQAESLFTETVEKLGFRTMISAKDEVKEQLQWLNHENKETCNKQHDENSKEEMTDTGPFLGLLQRIGLEHHYPKMMSKADYHMICKTSVNNSQPASEQELPFYFLQKLLMIECGFRNLILKKAENDEPENLVGTCNEEIDTFDPFEDLSDDRDEPTDPLDTESQPRIHPMDIQMAIFHCADDLARQ